MKIKSQKDFYAGLMFVITGAAFGGGATSYTLGDGARMGPGYFPLLLGVLLAAIGLYVTVESLLVQPDEDGQIGAWAWRPLGFIIGANIVFGLCIGGLPKLGIPSLGLIVGIYALTFISSLASHEHRNKAVFFLATFLAILSYLAFVYLLKLQFPVWPSFLLR